MARARKAWSALSDSYRKRLSRGGITKRQYERGASLKAARGHAQTPEHPQDAYKAVGKYREYIERANSLHELVIERKVRLFGARFKYNAERSEQYVMQGGTDVPAPGIIRLKQMLELTDDEIEETLSDPDIDDDWKFLWYH